MLVELYCFWLIRLSVCLSIRCCGHSNLVILIGFLPNFIYGLLPSNSHSLNMGFVQQMIYKMVDKMAAPISLHLSSLDLSHLFKQPLKKKTKHWFSRLIIAQFSSKLLQREHSAILSAFIKLPFVIKIFVLSICEWPLKTGFTVLYGNTWFAVHLHLQGSNLRLQIEDFNPLSVASLLSSKSMWFLQTFCINIFGIVHKNVEAQGQLSKTNLPKIVIIFHHQFKHVFWVLLSTHNICFD